MIDFLVDEPILLVFLVVGAGAAVGSLSVHGISVGPATALFAGLGVGAIDEQLSEVAELGVIREFSLILFTYTLGVASGPSFFAVMRRGGAAAIAITGVLVALAAALTAVVAEIAGLSPADRAGVFAGATTNTPALQAATDALDEGDPVVGYSLAYPTAIAVMLVVLTLLLGRRLPLPASLEPPETPPPEPLINWTVRIDRDGLPSLGELRTRYPGLAFSRIDHAGAVAVARAADRPVPGDRLVVLGPASVVEAFCHDAGERSDVHLPLDRSALDFRRVLVSNRRIAGEKIEDLRLGDRFGVVVTRVRRGDLDVVVSDGMRVALGDHLRVVGPPTGLAQAARELGDSERRLSELDALGFAVGVAVGLGIGALAVPLPGDGELRLGAGGGALVSGLLAGRLSRVGPVTFQLPYTANLVLRQLGVLMFLAAAGLGSGATFSDAIGTRHGLELIIVGAIIAAGFALVVPLVVEVLLRRDVVDTAGMFAGVETQPAALAYVLDRTQGDDRVNTAYALAFPAAMIAKIVAVQFLV